MINFAKSLEIYVKFDVSEKINLNHIFNEIVIINLTYYYFGINFIKIAFIKFIIFCLSNIPYLVIAS